ncbi:MAG: DUF2344 domain-containing protein [Clostridia bacterium]|nr:DUF2344 domain-containing protein [Clostridia bacterium]
MRLAVVFTKEDPVRFVSHLDVQRLFQRAFRRAKLPLAYSQGFNPHPLVSFATALSVGMTSRGEYLDVMLTEPMTTDAFRSAVESVLPDGVRIAEVFDLGESRKSLTSAMRSADYFAEVAFPGPADADGIKQAIADLLASEIVVMKKTKGGIKPVDIRPMVISMELVKTEGNTAFFSMTGKLTAEGGLNPETLLGELYEKLGTSGAARIERVRIELDREALK